MQGDNVVYALSSLTCSSARSEEECSGVHAHVNLHNVSLTLQLFQRYLPSVTVFVPALPASYNYREENILFGPAPCSVLDMFSCPSEFYIIYSRLPFTLSSGRR